MTDEERGARLDAMVQCRLDLDAAYCAMRRTRRMLNDIENDLRLNWYGGGDAEPTETEDDQA